MAFTDMRTRHDARWRLRQMVTQFVLSVVALFAMVGACPTTAQAAEEPGLAGKRIVIDAGHGGRDGGAESSDGLQEKTVTLAVALRLADLLREAGAVVYLTRDQDTDLTTPRDRGHFQRASLKARTVFAKSKQPDAFISIHCNGSNSPAWRGAHVIYQKGNDQGHELARQMQAAFRTLLLPTRRDIEDASSLYLLKRIPGPTVLAEVGFITNPAESQALRTPAYQERVAFAIYSTVMQYFGGQPGTAEDQAETGA